MLLCHQISAEVSSEVTMEDIVVDTVVVDGERHTAVLVCGEIDCYTAPDLHARLLRLADTCPRPLVLDMSGVSFCDGSALRMLAAIERRCTERGTGLALVGLRPFLTSLFHAFGLHERIPLCATSQEALHCLLPVPDAELRAWLEQG
jgi:anti-sigma B factor antagonist